MSTQTTTSTSSTSTANTTTSPMKGFTRDEIMAMARYEYARQLCIYTKAQLSKREKSQSSSANTTNNVNSANQAAKLVY
jgi:hypothetical protein